MVREIKPAVKVKFKFAKRLDGVATEEKKRKREYTPEERAAFRAKMVAAKEQKRMGNIPEAISTPESVKEEPVKKAKRLPAINSYWLLAGLAIGLVALSILVSKIWFANPTNQILGLVAVALFIGGAWLIRRQIKHRHDIMGNVKVNITSMQTSATDGITTQPTVSSHGQVPNSLNIYAVKDGDRVMPQRLAFEYTENPRGQPQRCLNTGKFYYVHIWDIVTGTLKPFMLPDSKFTDPAIMARYLGLPSQKKYLRHRESLMHYIGPGILAVMCIGGFIAIIALSG